MKLNYLLLHIRNIFLAFLIVMDDYGNLGFVFPPIYISVKQEAMLDNFMFIITWSAEKCEYEWEYTSEIFYS